MKKNLPTRAEDYTTWYTEVIKKAALAEFGGARGAMIIKPYGYALWEAIKERLDRAIKATGHENAYFPLLIPSAYLTKEAEHVEGFAKECAVVTHYRLKVDPKTKSLIPDPDAQLEEPLLVRPTSETIIWDYFSRSIQSYRDLPVLLNQWANVVRMEMRTRLFLRTREILWQEGHTAHATSAQAQAETLTMLDVYTTLIREELAIPLVEGRKTAHEKFAGAEETYTMEALMQDGKALQLGTSHFLGQNFAKAFDVQFSTQEGTLDYVWGTSWGVTTRLIGALIMTHGDDQGLIMPPRIAPIQVVIVPIFKKDDQRQALLHYAQTISQRLQAKNIRVKLDDADTHHPGWKFNHYEAQGVPLRIAIGPRDLANHTLELARRDTQEKITFPHHDIEEKVPHILEEIQKALYQRALAFQKENTHTVEDWQSFKALLTTKRGFILAPWDGTTATEQAIQNDTKATIRCLPLDAPPIHGQKCIYTGKPAAHYALFAQAY